MILYTCPSNFEKLTKIHCFQVELLKEKNRSDSNVETEKSHVSKTSFSLFLIRTSKRECEDHSQAGWTNVSTIFRSLLLVVALLELISKMIRNSVAKTDHPGCCALVSLVGEHHDHHLPPVMIII